LLTGLANTQNPDVVVFLDGDYSRPPFGVADYLASDHRGAADITLGSPSAARATPCATVAPIIRQSPRRRPDQAFVRVKVSDLGPFAPARRCAAALALEEATYGWAVEMIVKGAIAGIRIVEVSVSYYRAHWEVQN